MRINKYASIMLSLLLLLSLFACASALVGGDGLNTALKTTVTTQNSTPQIIAYNYGITVQELTQEIATRLGIAFTRGAIVMDVKKGSTADETGIQSQDIILQVNRVKITSSKDYEREMAKASSDKDTLLLIKRGKSTFFVPLKFVANPSMAQVETIKPDQQSSAKKDEIIASLDSTSPVIQITSPKVFRGVILTAKDASITVIGTATDDSGVATVTVNGETAALDANGNFSAEVLLKVGENRIVVAATDIRKNTATESFTLVRAAGQVAKAKPEATQTTAGIGGGKYYGLLIAVQDYDSREINRLDHPITDAMAVKDLLSIRYTFDAKNIVLLKNPDRKGINNAFNDLRMKLNENDNLLIFFAGHGVWMDDMKEGYWLPRDASGANNPTDWIPNSTIRNYIRALKAKHVLLVADACFSGGIFKVRNAFAGSNVSTEKIYEMPSRKAITSGALKTVPDKSVFVEYFLKRLKENRDNYLDSQKLFVSFKEAVINNSPNNQTPLYGAISEAGDEGGDFVFVRRQQ